MKVRAVDFVQIQVRDMDRALGFYRDALGMPVGQAWGDEWVELAAGDTTIALAAEVEGVSVALSVDSVSDAVEELKAKGVEVVVGPQGNEWCASAAIRDPEGNLLVLHQRHDGTVG